MAQAKLPYVTAYGNITKALDKIQDAKTPPRFTHDFLATKLGMRGGSARPVVPYLKRIGFIASDGSPTELYRQFRGTDQQRGAAAAQGLRIGYASLFEVNEYANDLKEPDLKSLVVQVTGEESSSKTVTLIVKSFQALNDFADHDAPAEAAADPEVTLAPDAAALPSSPEGMKTLSLGYTINLQLPATSDIEVFDAIFKSLREHLMS